MPPQSHVAHKMRNPCAASISAMASFGFYLLVCIYDVSTDALQIHQAYKRSKRSETFPRESSPDHTASSGLPEAQADRFQHEKLITVSCSSVLPESTLEVG